MVHNPLNSAVCQPKDVKQALSERRYDALVTLGKVDLPGIPERPRFSPTGPICPSLRTTAHRPGRNCFGGHPSPAAAIGAGCRVFCAPDGAHPPGHQSQRPAHEERPVRHPIPHPNPQFLDHYLHPLRQAPQRRHRRKLIPFTDPELAVQYYITFLTGIEQAGTVFGLGGRDHPEVWGCDSVVSGQQNTFPQVRAGRCFSSVRFQFGV